LPLSPPPLLVTFHPVTLEYERTHFHVGELLAALEASGLPVVFTKPNADTSGRLALQMIEAWVQGRPQARLVDNLGTQGYFSLMSHAAAMVGNSSSGIIEAPSFQLPVVNIGNRQHGRTRAANVIDAGYERDAVLDGIRRAVSADGLQGLVNPFGDGHAAGVIVQHLKETALDERLLKKRFHDLPAARSRGAWRVARGAFKRGVG
jgi:UDP-N-acetylglucosamine 2-epimerase (non-hydrolysing)/GDP/UDP-N,N'-diacetylbacillosamine 2-epimerase (hydrolysing)